MWSAGWNLANDLGNGSLIYLSDSLPEQGFCTAIEIKNDRYFVKFDAHYDPSIDERVAVNYELKGEELKFFKTAIDNAADLNHNTSQNLYNGI